MLDEAKTEVLAADQSRDRQENTSGNRQDDLARGRKELSFADRIAHTVLTLRCVGAHLMFERRLLLRGAHFSLACRVCTA